MITIPAIDLRGAHVVRLKQGDPSQETVYGNDPVAVARRFRDDGARLIHVVDLDAALGTGDNREAIGAICAAMDVPVQIGGGLRSMEAVESVLELGASRAVLGTAATEDPVFLDEVVQAYGQRVIVALDVRDRTVMTHGWTQEAGTVDLILAGLAAQGVPRFMLTQIEVDGMLEGPDLELYRHAASFTDIPLIASGGVGTADDLRALADTGVEGAIVGKAIYEGVIDFAEVAEL
jgi:phosphoribosylformimino-5-aminoimidazole carboxamide ribotide isomerase